MLSNSPVMPGHSRSKNGVLSHAYVPGIHAFIQIRIIKDVDGRDKPGHDNVGNSASRLVYRVANRRCP
jgi:hypothetical protein